MALSDWINTSPIYSLIHKRIGSYTLVSGFLFFLLKRHTVKHVLLNQRNGPTLMIGLRSFLTDNEAIKQNIIYQGGQNNEKHKY